MDNRWVGNSVMKPVHSKSFKRRKDTIEGGDRKNDDFDIWIIEQGAPKKVLNAEKKTLDENSHGKQYMG